MADKQVWGRYESGKSSYKSLCPLAHWLARL